MAQALGEAFGQVAEAAEELGAGGGQEAAAFQELLDQVGDLQEEVPVLDLPGLGAVGMEPKSCSKALLVRGRSGTS